MVEEARLEQLEAGLTPVTDGWFVVNVRDGAWVRSDAFGDAVRFRRRDGGTVRRRRVHAPCPPARPAERDVPLGDEPGGLPRSRRRVPAAGRGRGAEAAGVGLRALPARNRSHLRRRGRRPLRHLHDRRPNPGGAHRLPALGARTPPWRGRREGDDRVPAEAYASFPKWQLGPPADWEGLPWA